jgi:hypothetical protein
VILNWLTWAGKTKLHMAMAYNIGIGHVHNIGIAQGSSI